MEIFTNEEGGVVFQKYSPIGEVGDFTMQYAEAVHKAAGFPVVICDLDSVVAAAGVPKKEYLEKPITEPLSGLLESRHPYSATESAPPITATERVTEHISYLSPIVSEGNVVGAVMSLSKDKSDTPDETAKKLINTGAMFLSSQLQV